MNSVNEPGVREVVFMTSAQIGKTEIINNICGFFIHQDPAPILLIQPTLELAETWSKDRLSPMLRDTEVLSDLVRDPRSRDSGNTLLYKRFPGGHLTMAGANSPASLASRPVRIVLLDEEDRYPNSAGAEGDPGSLAEKRSTTFWNRLLLTASTPTVAGSSKIAARYERSDQRKYFVPCPHCGEKQILLWGNIRFENKDPATAHYVCEHCGAILTDKDKPKMLAEGEWVATKPFDGIIGFHISELYSPWVKWPELVRAFFKAKRSPETFKTWVNTSLGETWEEGGETVEADSLLNRKESWGNEAPEEVVVVTAGVDVQGDRLEIETKGWGVGEESWSLDYKVFFGDPAQEQIWQELDAYLQRPVKSKTGVFLNIACACIDSGGHHTQAVYEFCRTRAMRGVFAVKGLSLAAKPLVGRPSRNNRHKLRLYPLGVDTAKEVIYSRLRITEPGPGYYHFPVERDKEYFQQLTAEKQVTRYHKGTARREWVKSRSRNEALDCNVYALAALKLLSPDLEQLSAAMQALPKPKPETPVSSSKPAQGAWIPKMDDWLGS